MAVNDLLKKLGKRGEKAAAVRDSVQSKVAAQKKKNSSVIEASKAKAQKKKATPKKKSTSPVSSSVSSALKTKEGQDQFKSGVSNAFTEYIKKAQERNPDDPFIKDWSATNAYENAVNAGKNLESADSMRYSLTGAADLKSSGILDNTSKVYWDALKAAQYYANGADGNTAPWLTALFTNKSAEAAGNAAWENIQNMTRSGNSFYLKQLQAELKQLKKEGYQGKGLFGLGPEKYSNQDKIDAKQAEIDKLTGLYRGYGYEEAIGGYLNDAMPTQQGQFKTYAELLDAQRAYSFDDYYADLETVYNSAEAVMRGDRPVNYGAYYDALGRVKNFAGGMDVIGHARASVNDPGYDFMGEYAQLYEDRTGMINQHIADKSSVYDKGDEFTFDADDLMSYLDANDFQTASKTYDVQQTEKITSAWGDVENEDHGPNAHYMPKPVYGEGEYDPVSGITFEDLTPDWMAAINELVHAGESSSVEYNAMIDKIANDPNMHTAQQYLSYGLNYMTPKQREKFYSLYNSGDEEGALQFIEDISGLTKKQRIQTLQQGWYDAASDGPLNAITASIASVGTNLMGSLAGTATMLHDTLGIGDPTGAYDSANEWGLYTQASRAGVTDQIDSNLWKTVYGGGMSFLDSAASYAVFGKPASKLAQSLGFSAKTASSIANNVTSLAQSFNSASNTYQQLRASGMDNANAQVDSYVDGAIEFLTEKYSIEGLFGETVNPIKAGVRQLFVEPSEETVGYVLRLLYDGAKYGDNSELKQLERDFELKFGGKEEAQKAVRMQVATELLDTVLTAVASAGIGATVTQGPQIISDYRTGSKLKGSDSALYDIASTTPDLDPEIQKIVQEMGASLQTGDQAQPAEQKASDAKTAGDRISAAKAQAEQQKNNAIAEGLDGQDARSELAGEKKARAQENAEQQKNAETEADQDSKDAKTERAEEKYAQARSDAEQQRNAEIADALDGQEARSELTGEKNAQAQENAEQQKNAETGNDSDSKDAKTERAEEKYAQDRSDAEQQKNAAIAEGLSSEGAKTELTGEKNAQAQENAKKAKEAAGAKAISNAKRGMVYRAVMQKLDAQAQDALRNRMSFDVAEELKKNGVEGESARDLAISLLRVQDGSHTPEDLNAILADSGARKVLLDWTAKLNASDVAVGRVNKLAGLLTNKGGKTADNINADTDEDELPKAEDVDEFDLVIAEVQAREGSMLVSGGETSTVDGEAVEIVGVEAPTYAAGSPAPQVKVRTSSGETKTVAADSIAYGENDAGVYKLTQYASQYGKNAGVMFAGYQPGQNVDAYAKAFNKAYKTGNDGTNLDALKSTGAVENLGDAVLAVAYNLGRDLRTQAHNQQQMVRSAKGAMVPVGNVDTSAIRKVQLTRHQRKTIGAMSRLAKALGINVRFVQSRVGADGKYEGDHGTWNADTRTITLDINAGKLSRGSARSLMMDTAGHELTHYIKQFADSALWDEYQDFVMSHLSGKLDLEKAINQYMSKNKDFTRDDAIEEIIAQASAKALSKITAQDLADLAESNPTLYGKIRKFLNKWIKGLKKAIHEAFDSGEGESNYIARAMEDELDEMAGMWNTLLVVASQNAHESRSVAEALRMSTEAQQAIENNQAVDAETEVKHALRMDDEFGQDAMRINQKDKFVSDETLEKALEDRAKIREIFLDPANKNLLKLPPDIMGDTFVSDASYGGTEENTTVCIRSMAAQALMDLISQNLGRPLTVQDTLLISQEIAGLTDRPECYYCYVATDRRAYRDFLGQYLKQRDEVIKKYKAGADRAALYEEFLGGRKPTANMKTRFNMWLNAVDNGTALIDGNDLASLENLFGEVDSLRDEILAVAAEASGVDASKLNIVNGSVRYAKSGKQITATTLNALMKSNPDMADSINRYKQLTDATAYAQSASWAKKMKGYAAYNGHILKWSQKRVSDLNKHYGLRMYSFSDFSPAFILENMQMVTDAAVRGLNMLGYTKEMPFAEIFAPSGMNINISTFAYEQGGEVKEDYKQGASWERAKALREKHPNVGIVMVATSDNILEWALQQDWVDVVIPYHLVRTGADVAEYFGYKNYTGVSADGKGLSFAEKNKGKSKKERVTSVSPVEHRNDLISYVDALESYGLTPRFAQWLKGLDDYRSGNITAQQFRDMNPNYMKLVNETRRSYAETDPVQPKFDMNAAQEAIQQMIREGGYYTPVGGSMEAEFEIAGTVADKIRAREDVKHMARMEEENYSTAGMNWAIEEGLLTKADQRILHKTLADKDYLKYNVAKTKDGKYVIPCDTVIVFASGTYKNPVIEDVVIFNVAPKHYERAIENAMEVLYGDERSYLGRISKYEAYEALEALLQDGSATVFPGPIRTSDNPNGAEGRRERSAGRGTAQRSGEWESEESVGDDIKHQQRDLSDASDRELLANALESLTANADELDILRRYQKRVKALDAKQQQLDDVENQLYALKQSDPKGNRDEIVKLTNNAKTLSSQISRMDKDLLKLEVMAPVKKLADRERESYKQKLKAQSDERMRQYKERLRMDTEDKIREVREREAEKRRKLREQGDTRLRKAVQEQREVGQRKVERLKEGDMKLKYKGRIMKDVGTMREWLTKPNNKGHVPQFLRAPLADFLESLDFSSDRSLKGGDSTQADAKMLEKMEALRRALANTRSQQTDIENGEAAFRGYMDLPEGFADRFDEALANIKSTLAKGGTDTPINRMTGEQLKELSDMIRTINTAVRQMNSFLSNSRYQKVSEAARSTMTTLGKLGDRVSKSALMEKVSGFLDWTNTTPYYAFRRFGEGGKAIFEALQDGWDKLAFNSKELIDYANSVYTTKQVREWSDQLHTISLNGKNVQMTTAQIMSLYCLNKRAQARGHLLGGGIRVADIQVKGKKITQADNHTLTEADIQKITGLLTKEQIEVADKLQEFMNTRCTEWGNEVSMKRFGYEFFGDEANYFPIETDSNNRKAIDDQAQENSLFRLLNISATKSTVKNANNALVVRDIFDVFSSHGTDMAKYNALALPILDALKWYNYVDKTNYDDGSLDTESTQKALEKAYGKDAQKYIKSFLRDLNGVREGGRNDGLVSKMISNYKVAAVANNLRVGMLQITSMPRAAYAINPKYLAAGLAKNVAFGKSKAAREDVGIGLWKSLGFYDTNISRNVREMVKHDQSFGDKVKEKSMILAEKGDAWTLGVLYGAVESEMADKHPGISKGSEAYKKMVNDRMREIVYQTQVVDSTMTRSDIMRDTKGLASLTTAFMSEPTLTMNMLSESIFEQRMKARETGKKFIAPSPKMVKAFAVNAFVLTFSAVMESLFTAWRDDDEYETFEEKFNETFGSTLLDNFNLANNLPFVKDIIGAVQGQSADRMDSAWAVTLYGGVNELYKYLTGQSKNPPYNGIYKTLNGLSQMSGYAVGGLTRELVSAYNNLIATPMGYKRIQTYADSTSDAAKAIVNAYAAGDEELLARYLDLAAQYGVDEKKLQTAIRSAAGDAYSEGKLTEEDAIDAVVAYGGKSEDEAYWIAQEWEYTGDGDFNKYGALTEAMTKGDRNAAKAAIDELVKHGTKEDSVVSKLSSMYNNGDATTIMNLQMRSDRLYTSNLKLKKDGQVHKDDFDDFIGAIVSGKGIAEEIKKLKEKGYTTKQCMSAINGAFGKSSDRYRIMEKHNPTEAKVLLNQILDAYEVLGLSREEEIEWINENWTMPADE